MNALNIPDKPWWETDNYAFKDAVPDSLTHLSGPNGVALLRAYQSGMTQKGWGLQPPKGESDAFMPRYTRGEFLPRRALFGYDKGETGFAFVMRSMKVLVIDIDGKNGGLEHATELGNLPLTLSETSKGGNGYHLFYETDEVWDEAELGYAGFPDQIGIVQGVDIRAVGCVYHWQQQRWNNRPIAKLPTWLADRMLERQKQRLAAAAKITNAVASQDPEELMLMQSDLEDELKKPIAAGKRNTSLFAIGNKMKVAGITHWEGLIRARAADIGLEQDEIEKLIRNITRYDA